MRRALALLAWTVALVATAACSTCPGCPGSAEEAGLPTRVKMHEHAEGAVR